MNYRHAFHAGSFADVLKHAVLTRALLHLREKEAAFCVIDTHAGAGRYDLAGAEASRTQEWQDGIGKLWNHPPDGEAGELLAPYLALVRAENPNGALRSYPGSPLIARALCRPQDRMVWCELEPAERNKLAASLGHDRRAQVSELDGWTALKSLLPPGERRGLVLVDPPFEEPNEFERLLDGLTEAHRRFATGVYLLWYAIKDPREAENFARRVARLGITKILRIELTVGSRPTDDPLAGCGLIAVNPPWTLEPELKVLLPALARLLGHANGGGYRLDRLAGEH
jgi:23S rRNA (adenine2030-N6)-methyltransferase